jgi:hypothetical protein
VLTSGGLDARSREDGFLTRSRAIDRIRAPGAPPVFVMRHLVALRHE